MYEAAQGIGDLHAAGSGCRPLGPKAGTVSGQATLRCSP